MHNLIVNKKPLFLYDQLKLGTRSCAKIGLKDFPATSKRKNTLLFQGISWYNRLPMYLKALNPNNFKIQIKRESHLIRDLREEWWRAPNL